MVRRWLSGLLAGAMVALAGCTTIQPVPPATPVTQSQPAAPTAPPAATPIPTPAAAATLTPEETVAAQVIAALAEQTQLSPADMTVVSVEAVEWPDACLGVDNPDEMCAAVITPGFSVVIETPNGQYEVHTNADASSIRVASAPDTALVAPVIEWQQAGADCRRAVIGSDSLAVGTCAGTLVSGAFGSPARAGELAELTATFAPFTAEPTAGGVVVDGAGVTAARPA